jgi:hypothetical protein
VDLNEFLMSLAEDPRKAADLKERPHEVLEEAGLAEDDAQLILSGDPVAIYDAIGELYPPGARPPRPGRPPRPNRPGRPGRPGPPGKPGQTVVVVVVVIAQGAA